jgi:holin-like protein
MITAFAILLVSQLAGEAIVRVASLPIPGPVVGMVLLFALMVARTPLPPTLGETADGLLRHLSLLFVPAGAGVVQHLDRLGTDAARLLAVVVIATAITLAVTALVFEFVARWMSVDEGTPQEKQGAP